MFKIVIGSLFMFFGILILFSNAPLWDAIINLAIGYLFLEKEN